MVLEGDILIIFNPARDRVMREFFEYAPINNIKYFKVKVIDKLRFLSYSVLFEREELK